MNDFGWNSTVALSVMGIIYGCLLGIVGRAQGIRLNKLGFCVGSVGTIVLATMAVIGPMKNLEKEGTVVVMENEQDVPQRNLLHKKLISVYHRTFNKRGKRPTKNHVAYEDENGKLSWILKENYIKILTRKYKEESK